MYFWSDPKNAGEIKGKASWQQISRDNIDYYAMLKPADLCQVGDTVIFGFRPQAFVTRAYTAAVSGIGAAGVDEISIEQFDENLKDNLYKLWNRMSSGSYFPPPVKAGEIPKKNGGIRVLGIPTVSDRIAQMAVKIKFEEKVEPYFKDDSFGYRPNKSAHDALEVTRSRCWKYNWCLNMI